MKRQPHSTSTAGTAWARLSLPKPCACAWKRRGPVASPCARCERAHTSASPHTTRCKRLLGRYDRLRLFQRAGHHGALGLGITPMLGTNPFSMSVPAGKHSPIVLDSSSSIVARGKINLAEIEGRPIPIGLGHRQTRASDNAMRPRLCKGSVLPFGEHKGYGIALMIDILSGILSGAGYGTSSRPALE